MARTSVIAPEEPAYEGQRHYTPAFLRIYDTLVLRVFCPLVWRCPASRLVEQYDQHVGRRHLDVGPGTGSLLAWADLPPDTRVTLADPNPDVLAHASRRLAARAPVTVEADVLKPLGGLGPFDSIAISNVLHCLPGPMSAREPAIRNLADVLAPGGVLFGSTVLGSRELHGWFSYAALRSNVEKGFFDNLDDDEGELRSLLTATFARVDIEVVGSMALFRATEPVDAHARPR
jgi:SAM-dependent methyltransferase